MAGQMKASFSNLERIEKKMSKLHAKLQGRRLHIEFQSAKGGVIDAMMESAEQLNRVEESLCNLTGSTEQIIKDSRTSFENIDAELARKIVEFVQIFLGTK